MNGPTYLLVLAMVVCASGHLCLLTPRQRGDLDISQHGSPTCSRHQEPCGGLHISQSDQVLMGGVTQVIKWQQNFNHYATGFPGYMDVSYGNATNGTADPASFVELAALGDGHPFSQDNQRNYTLTVVLPNKTCEHCVIRVRYNSHKPGETPFYQCADIKIIPSTMKGKDTNARIGHQASMLPPAASKALHFIQDKQAHRKRRSSGNENAGDARRKMVGIAYNSIKPEFSRFVEVDMWTGEVRSSAEADMLPGLDVDHVYTPDANGDPFGTYMTDQVFVTDSYRGVTLTMYHDERSLDLAAFDLLITGSRNGSVLGIIPLHDRPTEAINGMVERIPGQYYAFSLTQQWRNPGHYIFEIYEFNSTGATNRLYSAPTTEELYVNYLWMTYNPTDHVLYVLMGNENAPFNLSSRLYTYDMSGEVSFKGYTELNVSEFPVQSIFFNADNKSLITMSPGPWGRDLPSWSLVQIDATSGDVTELCQVAPPGLFANDYSGAVVNPLYFEDESGHPSFFYILRTPDSASDVITQVYATAQGCDVTFSQMTSLRHVHNIALV